MEINEAIQTDADKTIVEMPDVKAEDVVPAAQSEDTTPADAPLSDRESIAKAHSERMREELNLVNKPAEGERQKPELPDEVEIKVNGRTRKVARDKVEAAGGVDIYQKMVAADEGLREVAEQRKRMESEKAQIETAKRQWAAEQQRIQAQSQEIAKQRQVAQQQTASQQAAQTDAQIRRMISEQRQALVDGDDKKADALFEQIIDLKTTRVVQSRTPPQQKQQPIDINQVASVAAQRARATLLEEQRAQDLSNAQKAFRDEYDDLASEPRLFQMTDAETITVQREHPDWSPSMIIREAASRVRNWYKPQPAAVTSSRVEAKRANATPKAASGRSSGASAPKALSKSEIVANIRQARGLD